MIVPKIWCAFLIAVLVGIGLTIADREFNETEYGVTTEETNGFDYYHIREMKDVDNANENEEVNEYAATDVSMMITKQGLREFWTAKQDAEIKDLDDVGENEEVNEYVTTDVNLMSTTQELREFSTAKQDAEIKDLDDDENDEVNEYTTTDVSTMNTKQDLREFLTAKQDAEVKDLNDNGKNEEVNEYSTTDVNTMSTKQDLREFSTAKQDAEIKDLHDDSKNEDINEYTTADVSSKQDLPEFFIEKQNAGTAHLQNRSAVISTLLRHVLTQNNVFKPGMFSIDKEVETTEPNVDDSGVNFTNSSETTTTLSRYTLTESSVRVPGDTSFTILPVKTGTAMDDTYLDNTDGFEFINLVSTTSSEPTSINSLLSTFINSDDIKSEVGVSTTSIAPQAPEYVEMDKPFPFLEPIEEFDVDLNKTAEEMISEDYDSYPTFKEELFETWLEERKGNIEDEEVQTEIGLIDVPEGPSYVHANLLDESNVPCMALNVTYNIFINGSELKMPVQYGAITQYKDSQGIIAFHSGDDSEKTKISVVFNLSCTKDYCRVTDITLFIQDFEQNIDVKCEQKDLSLFKTDYGFASENEDPLIYAMNNEILFQIEHAKLHVMQRCAPENDFRQAFPIIYYQEILGASSVILILAVIATYVAIKANRKKKLVIGS